MWTNWIMQCVRSPVFSIIINGVLSRRLRQGDPLSPYLFILCTKVLSRMLKRETRMDNLKGVQVSKGGTTLTHSLFADDLVVFRSASRQTANAIKQCLESYCY